MTNLHLAVDTDCEGASLANKHGSNDRRFIAEAARVVVHPSGIQELEQTRQTLLIDDAGSQTCTAYCLVVESPRRANCAADCALVRRLLALRLQLCF